MNTSSWVQQVLDMGAFRASVIPVSQVVLSREFRDLCEKNYCGIYNKCWVCPPDCGDIDDLMNQVRSYDQILVYQTVGKLEDSFDLEGMRAAGRRQTKLNQKVLDWSKTLPVSRSRLLGGGGCGLCEVCAKVTNEPCRHPDRALPALEAYGVDVSRLASAAGMKYINGQNTVTYFGGLLFTV